ncbi:MAG: hypothetical protein ABSE46_24765 [Terracidiphilus sp.]
MEMFNPAHVAYEEALADYQEALAAEQEVLAKLRCGRTDDEVEADLFCSEEEDDRAIQAMLEDDPEGEEDIPWEQVKAEGDRLLAELEAASKRRLAAQKRLAS